MSINDFELWNACLKGDRKAQKELYERFAPKMFAVALRYCSGQQEAEDALQEGFIKVFEYLGNFRQECPLEQWIKRIVINTALKQNRSKLYLYPAFDVQELEMSEESPSSLDIYRLDELLQMIQQLAPRYRVIFNLYAIEGYQHKEIAEILQISEGTSKSQYSRAKLLLQQMIAQEEAKAAYESQQLR